MLGKRSKAAAVVMLAGAMTASFAASSATASPSAPPLKVVKVLSSKYFSPLQFAVSGRSIFVADSFSANIFEVGRNAPVATGSASPAVGGDVGGIGVDSATHRIAYTTSQGDQEGNHTMARVAIIGAGQPRVVADLLAFEKKYNPDQINHYGVTNYGSSSPKCVNDALASIGAPVPVSYTGAIDSHPYSVTPIGGGAWAVADAGMNAIVKVDARGVVSLLSVLPSQAVKVTPEALGALGLPSPVPANLSCLLGITYNFEPVPTDVEVGPGKALYATTLASTAPGSVYKISSKAPPALVATGFVGATNLAVDKYGHIFVAELFAGTVSEIVNGKPVVVLQLPGVVALEYANGQLYASTAPAAAGAEGPQDPNAPPPPPGQIVVLGS
jgi:hypothetical protein